ncbi:MAG: hypothetical protein HZB68_03485 [Candidatus Aenigmarchaeota archaeon]|nr:hypothetical protein [Candidatus Aenigmarchaeota archaeon]
MSVAIKLAQRLVNKSYISEFIELGIHKDISPEDYLFEIGMAETVSKEYSKELDAARKGMASLEKEVSRYEELSGRLDAIVSRLNAGGITPDYYLKTVEMGKLTKKEISRLKAQVKVYETEEAEIVKYITEKVDKELKPMEMLGSRVTDYMENLIDCASRSYSWETYEKYLYQKQPKVQSAATGSLDAGQYGTEILGASVLSGKFGMKPAISQELRNDSLEYLEEMEGILEYSESVANQRTKDGDIAWKLRFDSWLQSRLKQMNQEFAEFMQYLQAKKSGK